jgi:6-phosphogluconolactonase
MQLHINSTPEETLDNLARYFVAAAQQAVTVRDRFVVVLSGGNSPKKLYELLASPAYREQVAWEKTFFFFGDERYVPHTDSESNYLMAKTTFLDALQIPAKQIFAFDTALEPAAAAQQYTQTIEQFFASEPSHFDLVLMGLGDDAHTASLFPGTPVLQETEAIAKEVFVEEKQVYRLTMTAPLLNQGRAFAFLVHGKEKAPAVQHVLGETRDTQKFPAQLIAPITGELHWFLDQDAASLLPPRIHNASS